MVEAIGPDDAMLINNSDIHIDDEADFVIVGSGAAGSTCARYLAAAGKSVIVLEEGAPAKPAPGDALEAMTTLYRDAGASATVGEDVIPLIQGRCVGGTTVINGAIQVPFPEWIWKEWVANDPKWEKLLPWKELEAAREWMDKELHIAPTPPSLWGQNGGMLLKGLGDVAHPTRRNAPNCLGSGRCLQGCPTGAKQSMDISLLPKALADGARLYASCEAQKVIIKGRRAVGVQGRFKSGAKMVAHAKQAVIMAASAVQTPYLLMKSGITLKGNGFQCHPGVAMAGLFPQQIHGMPEATQSMESLHWCKDDFKFESLGMPRAFRAVRVPGIGPKLQERLAQLDHVAFWGVACRAEARGKVIKSPVGPLVKYSPTPKNRRVMLRGLSILAEAMLHAGAKEVWPAVYGFPETITTVEQARTLADVPPTAGLFPMAATHLFCGVQVRDRFQVLDVDGLVVADSSLFPSNTGVNPVSSITAVATLVTKAWI
jgi:hypothetical protein